MKFDVIVMDVPWQYNNKNTGGTLLSGSDKKYPTMSLKQLEDLKSYLNKVMKDNCVIFFWITNPFLEEGLHLVKHYGFKYKSLITWVKNGKGLGYWYRGNTEHMIVGIKGKLKAFHSQNINVFHADTKQHSQKPMKSYELIMDAVRTIPDCKVLEIFARKQYRDWVCIGYDLDGLVVEDALEAVLQKDGFPHAEK